MLIYSLLSIDLEKRTFEIGVNRTLGKLASQDLGSRRYLLVKSVLLFGLSFSLLAWVIGTILAQSAGTYAVTYLADFASIPLDVWLQGRAVLLPFLLAIVVPILSAVLPIYRALSHPIMDSINPQHSQTTAVEISIEVGLSLIR